MTTLIDIALWIVEYGPGGIVLLAVLFVAIGIAQYVLLVIAEGVMTLGWKIGRKVSDGKEPEPFTGWDSEQQRNVTTP